jgi:hypothetical protein
LILPHPAARGNNRAFTRIAISAILFHAPALLAALAANRCRAWWTVGCKTFHHAGALLWRALDIADKRTARQERTREAAAHPGS